MCAITWKRVDLGLEFRLFKVATINYYKSNCKNSLYPLFVMVPIIPQYTIDACNAIEHSISNAFRN